MGHSGKNLQRNREIVLEWAVGVWVPRVQSQRASIGVSPEIKYKRSKNFFTVTSIALSLGHFCGERARLGKTSKTGNIVVARPGWLNTCTICCVVSEFASDVFLASTPCIELWVLSNISFKKTFCLMNIRPEDLFSHEQTLWFRRHQLFGLGAPSFYVRSVFYSLGGYRDSLLETAREARNWHTEAWKGVMTHMHMHARSHINIHAHFQASARTHVHVHTHTLSYWSVNLFVWKKTQS